MLISGAAGGLGTVLVQKFAALGYNVIAVDINNSGFTSFNGLKNVRAKTCDFTNTANNQNVQFSITLQFPMV